MKFLIDNALSPVLAEELRKAGHNAKHVRDFGMQSAADTDVLGKAATEGRTLISADTDFGSLLARSGGREPSVILFRIASPRRPQDQARLLLKNLPSFSLDLAKGAVVVFEKQRLRIRSLPI